MYIKLERKKVAIRVEKHKNRSITQIKQLSKKKNSKKYTYSAPPSSALTIANAAAAARPPTIKVLKAPHT